MAYKIHSKKLKEKKSYSYLEEKDDPNADETYHVGDLVKVKNDNDNEGYNSFRKKTLKVTHVDKDFDKEGGYLYSFEDENGKEINSSLYAWELESI
jgi:hypothetical protein